MCQVINRAQWADGIMQVRTVEELTEDLEADDVDLAADMHVAVVDGESDGGAIAGFVHTLLLPSEVLHVRCYVFGDVEPAGQFRHAHATALLEEVEDPAVAFER